MTTTPAPELRAETAKLAYHHYLDRVRLGLPGDERDDWIRAETELQKRTPLDPVPLLSIKGIGPRVAAELENAGIVDCVSLGSLTLSEFAERLPRLAARARSGAWIEQARSLCQPA